MAGTPPRKADLTLPPRSPLPVSSYCFSRRFGVPPNLIKLSAAASTRALLVRISCDLIEMASSHGDDAGAAPKADNVQQSDVALKTDTEQQSSFVDTDSGDSEEGRDAYRPGGFHPVYIGDVYANKYEVMSKIGYGRYSTVWLVKDLSTP